MSAWGREANPTAGRTGRRFPLDRREKVVGGHAGAGMG
jgi:hypothetical protein